MVKILRRLPENSPLRIAHPICVASKIVEYYKARGQAFPGWESVPTELIERSAKKCIEEGKIHGIAKLFRGYGIKVKRTEIL